MEKMLVSGVAADKNVARIAVTGLKDVPGVAFSLFNLISKNNINVDLILQSIGRSGTKDISFTVASENVDDVLKVLSENKAGLSFHDVDVRMDVAKVSIVGAGMMSNPGVACRMFEALYDAGINIRMISTSEIKISVLIDQELTEKAMVSIHDKFHLAE